MGMEFSIGNLFKFISYITPFLVIFTFILIGFLNYEPIKPLLYLSGVVVTTFFGILIQRSQSSNDEVGRSAMCDMWELPFSRNTSGYDLPSISILFLSYTLLYVVVPMVIAGDINYPIMLFLIMLLGADIVNKVSNSCTNVIGVIASIFFGGIFGGGISSLLYYTIPEHLYIQSMNSNKVSCSRKKQKFICVKKDKGKLTS